MLSMFIVLSCQGWWIVGRFLYVTSKCIFNTPPRWSYSLTRIRWLLSDSWSSIQGLWVVTWTVCGWPSISWYSSKISLETQSSYRPARKASHIGRYGLFFEIICHRQFVSVTTGVIIHSYYLLYGVRKWEPRRDSSFCWFQAPLSHKLSISESTCLA